MSGYQRPKERTSSLPPIRKFLVEKELDDGSFIPIGNCIKIGDGGWRFYPRDPGHYITYAKKATKTVRKCIPDWVGECRITRTVWQLEPKKLELGHGLPGAAEQRKGEFMSQRKINLRDALLLVDALKIKEPAGELDVSYNLSIDDCKRALVRKIK